ncbi:hypothetical protein ABZT34_05600 [Streptomyces sp. NPDC005329]|uniref:zinc-binding dehydrogenase n=1 Tax=Streptomyces sp. NPDC005329 TaxID=3157034 RepID=UPI0033A773CE
MRAVAMDAVPASPAVGEVDTPRPAAGELLVKVAASSVNGFDLAEQVTSGSLRVPVTTTYPLERAAEAFSAFTSGTPGKIAVTRS